LQEWYTRGIGGKLINIVETENVSIDKNIMGKLLIVEYTSKRKRILQRILITRYEDKILVLECGSTVKKFYKYSEVFNNVMGSIIFEK